MSTSAPMTAQPAKQRSPRRDDGHGKVPGGEQLEVLGREGARVDGVAHEKGPRAEPQKSCLRGGGIVALIDQAST